MKKFWMISMLLIAALFFVGCEAEEENGGNGGNGGNGDNNSKACTDQGAFRCSGDMLQKCDQEEWKNFEQCSADKPCNAEKGACVAGGSTEPTNPTEPTTEPTTNPGNDLNCGEIYDCMVNCGSDGDCQQGCYDKGSANGKTQIMALIQCLNTCSESSATDDEFQECATSQCSSEISNCEGLGGGAAGDTSYASPYGSAQINISSTYIVTDADGNLGQEMVTMGSFISGNYGNSQIVPAAAAQSYYYTSMYTDQGETIMQTIQYFTDSTGQNILNPLVVAITNVNASVGSNYYGLLEQTGVGYIMLMDVTVVNNQLNPTCYHAFSEGELTVNNLSAAAGSAGALAVSGTVNIYSPKNYANSYGDISDQLGVDVCPAK